MNDEKNIEKTDGKTAEYTVNGIRVKVTYPDRVNETIRQYKINKMYDIFIGAIRRNETEKFSE